MHYSSLVIAAPGQVELQSHPLSPPGAGEVLVAAEASAISAGTEMLAYRCQLPEGMTADVGTSPTGYPMKLGYSMVGRVVSAGAGVECDWHDARVFAFQPHQSHFVASCAELVRLPPGMSAETGIFLPNMETAINLLQDGQPLLGEDVLVVGQGVVGLLTTALLARCPLARLLSVDLQPNRRALSEKLGARSCSPENLHEKDFDLAYELSGQPAALNLALAATGFAGRVVIGSWYGGKRAEIELGGDFHRSRIRLLSSQVSTIDPVLTGRWNKARRLQLALSWLTRIAPQTLITHTFPLREAAQAYALLDSAPQEAVQVVLTY